MEKPPLENFKTEARRRLMERARQDAFFVGWALALYQRLHDMDDPQLARWLQCSDSDLTKLALCRRPDGNQKGFQQDVGKIAAFAACHPDRLVQVLREVAVWDALKEENQEVARGFLLAARDRKLEGDDSSGPSEGGK
ncbi:MAG: hypothetical protein ACOZFS_09805 [Thermodesulfobacteriota bacterium]